MRTLLILLVLACGSIAAPAPKFDEIAGEIYFPDDNSPTVTMGIRTPEGEWVAITYWLVFTSRELEQQACKFDRGTVVKASGRLGGGGKYQYLIVSKIEAK